MAYKPLIAPGEELPLAGSSSPDRQVTPFERSLGQASTTPLVDAHGRVVNYLRLSITDRCNLRCQYCVTPGFEYMQHADILTYEEMLELVGLARHLGIRKVRLTGGEPLVRKGFLWFVERLRGSWPDMDLRLTTNGTLLAGKVAALKDLGLSHINISLDTLNPDTYQRITGRNFYEAVRRAMDEVMDAGLHLKVNAVAMRGVNDHELGDFVSLVRDNPLDMRFIEYMPMGADSAWNAERFWAAEDIIRQARELEEFTAVPRSLGEGGPARMFVMTGGRGRLGVISPLSDHFCGTCNRLRITPEGGLRTCLFSDRQYRLRPLLRHPRLGPQAVLKVMRLAGQVKPVGHELLIARRDQRAVAMRRMTAIGG